MKYGLLYETNTGNIGDDIQSYASMQFLPQVDYLIDREHLDQFTSKNNEKVASIFNAWFLNNRLNWPPANSIIPLCIAMHFAMDDSSGLDLGLSFLEGMGGDFLRCYGPIGCRDSGTVKLLKERGIDAYFSGCLTLTLPKQKQVKGTKPYICLVDVPDKVYDFVKGQVLNQNVEILCLSHRVEILTEWKHREKRVEQFLQRYQNAQCVITTRLHCALPCLAMEVPVLYLEDSQEYRTADFLELLTHSTIDAFCNGEFLFSVIHPVQNSTKYIAIREALIQKVVDFIEKTSNDDNIYCSFFSKSNEERYLWKIKLLQQQLMRANQEKNIIRNKLDTFIDTYCEKNRENPSLYKLIKYNVWKLFHR